MLAAVLLVYLVQAWALGLGSSQYPEGPACMHTLLLGQQRHLQL